MTGAAVMLPLAMMVRASQKDEGTPWYKVKVSENHTVDLRPFAPFVQYLFVADVLQDFYDNTDWGMVSEDLDLGKYSWDNIGEAFFKGGRYDGAYAADDIAKGLLSMVSAGLWDLVEMPGSAYQFYEGKYTSQSLGKEIMNVAASTSQLAGTTLSLLAALATGPGRGKLDDGEVWVQPGIRVGYVAQEPPFDPRSTGFYVARGRPSPPKSETTIGLTREAYAPGRFELLAADWLDKWHRSGAKFPAALAEAERPHFERRIVEHGQFKSDSVTFAEAPSLA
jgi:hypothetical protein